MQDDRPSDTAAYVAMGFLHVASGPLVRSSYRAAEVFVRALLTTSGAPGGHDPAWVAAALRARLDDARRGAQRVAEALGDPGTTGPQVLPASSLVRRA